MLSSESDLLVSMDSSALPDGLKGVIALGRSFGDGEWLLSDLLI